MTLLSRQLTQLLLVEISSGRSPGSVDCAQGKLFRSKNHRWYIPTESSIVIKPFRIALNSRHNYNCQLGTLVDPPDVMNHAHFHLEWMICFWASSSQKRGFSHWNALWLLQHCLTLPCWQVMRNHRDARNNHKWTTESVWNKTKLAANNFKFRHSFSLAGTWRC
jgi:hypothetical protein